MELTIVGTNFAGLHHKDIQIYCFKIIKNKKIQFISLYFLYKIHLCK